MTAFLVKTIMVFGFVLYMGGPMEAVRSIFEPASPVQAGISDLALKSGGQAVQCVSMAERCEAPWLIMPLARPASWDFGESRYAPQVLPRQSVRLVDGLKLGGCIDDVTDGGCADPGSKDQMAEKATAKLLFQSIGQ